MLIVKLKLAIRARPGHRAGFFVVFSLLLQSAAPAEACVHL